MTVKPIPSASPPPTLPTTKVAPLTSDPSKVGAVFKLNVPLPAIDSTGKAVTADLAELDIVSARTWINAIKDWRVRNHYRKLLKL